MSFKTAKRTSIILINILIFNVLSFSQNETIVITPVLVAPDRNFFLNKEIDTTFLYRNNLETIDKILASTGQVYVQKATGLASTVSIMGMGAQHTTLLLNGISLNSPMLGQADFSVVSAFGLSKIKILQGLNSLQQTGGALGGAVSLTAGTDREPYKAKIKQTFSSFQNTSGGIILKNTGKHKITFGFNYSAGKNHFKFKNTAIPGEPTEWNNAKFLKTGIFILSQFEKNKKKLLQTFFWLNSDSRKIPPLMSYEGLHRDETQNNFMLIGGLELKKHFSLLNNIKIAYILNKTNYFLADSVLSIPVNQYIIKSDAQSSENRLTVELKLNKGYRKTRINITYNPEYQNVTTYNKSNFVDAGYSKHRLYSQLSEKLTIKRNYSDLGTIINLQTNNLQITSPSFTIFWEGGKNTLFYKFYAGRNVKLPTLNDLYWQPGGNPNLKPEKSWTVQTYARFLRYNFSFDAQIFASLVQDWILWKPTQFHYWTPENIKKVFSRGIITNIKFKFGKKLQIKTIASYSFILSTNLANYGEFDLSVGKQLIYTPKHLASINVSIKKRKFGTDMLLTYTGKRFTSTSNYGEFTLKPYLYTELNTYYIWKSTKISIEINNILNTDYQVVLYRAEPLREFVFNIETKIK